MSKIRKTPARLDFPTVSSEEFVAVHDDNTHTASIMADKDILAMVQSSKNTIDADFDYTNEMSNVAHVPTLFEMRRIIKSVFSYLDNHSSSEMISAIDNIQKFADNSMLKEIMQ
ncbi:hypothetical protein TNCV_2381931 [Trichonephila clavipes]|nr:hypothetical protein TNCV_2381931 [Trichonephila clavipes]